MSKLFPAAARRYIESIFYAGYYPRRASLVQSDIDVVLSLASRRIARLPGENNDASKPFWDYCARQNDYNFNRLEGELIWYIANAIDARRIKVRSRNDEPLEAYLEGNAEKWLKDIERGKDRVKFSAGRDKDYFLTFASSNEITQFKDRQAELVAKLVDDVYAAKSNLEKRNEIAMEYGLEDPERLSRFINKYLQVSRLKEKPILEPKPQREIKPKPTIEHIIIDRPEFLVPCSDISPEKATNVAAGLNSVSGNLCKDIVQVAKAHELEPEQVVDFIFSFPELIQDSVRKPILAIPDYVQESLQKEWVVKMHDISLDVCKRLYDDHGVDIKYGHVVSMIRWVFGPDKMEDINSVIKMKSSAEPKLAQLRLIDPRRINAVNNVQRTVGEIFQAQSEPPRVVERESGGPARWGAAKPDLWKPDL
ncbi:MAG: hypothetical protein DI551_05545 [Micavibrio aeruginosavorus]|uniref:Uncharacterized protein n=1 Tax=Micavibrio aeruginosavorus TaxID=349221 RepID=A0A2W5MZI1_9BACT|nr:MAG: hypothetical protein DI551_05545 [Micavibrio aeruginosavorus]